MVLKGFPKSRVSSNRYVLLEVCSTIRFITTEKNKTFLAPGGEVTF